MTKKMKRPCCNASFKRLAIPEIQKRVPPSRNRAPAVFRPSAERVPVLVRRFSNADTRVTAEYHRFEIQPTDLHLLKADE